MTPRWRQLVKEIHDDIASGKLAPGQKVPSLREQQQAGWGDTTVKRAYRELEAEGLVTSVHGLGTFVADTVPAGSASLEDRVSRLEADVADIKGRLDRGDEEPA